MNKNIKVEAEGEELILRNEHGDYAIIPRKYRREVEDMIKEGCHGCIDALVATLPGVNDYAEDGSVINVTSKEASDPDDPKPTSPVVETHKLPNGFNFVIYDDKILKDFPDFKMSSGNFYIAKAAYDKMKKYDLSPEQMFTVIMHNRNVQEDFLLAKLKHYENKSIGRRVQEINDKRSKNIELNEDEKKLLKFVDYYNKVTSTGDPKEKQALIDGALQDEDLRKTYFTKDNRFLFPDEDTATQLYATRDALEALYSKNQTSKYINTTGTGIRDEDGNLITTNSRDWGIRSTALIYPENDKFELNYPYVAREYVGNPTLLVNAIDGILLNKFDETNNGLYYVIKGIKVDPRYSYEKELSKDPSHLYGSSDLNIEFPHYYGAANALRKAINTFQDNMAKNPEVYTLKVE